MKKLKLFHANVINEVIIKEFSTRMQGPFEMSWGVINERYLLLGPLSTCTSTLLSLIFYVESLISKLNFALSLRSKNPSWLTLAWLLK
jgi:hypothetical protein